MTYSAEVVFRDHAKVETEKAKWREVLQEHLDPYGQPAPQSFADETAEAFKRRTVPLIQQRAPGWQGKEIDATGETYDLLVRQVLNASKAESEWPTMVPEGELKEIKRTDRAGRPYYEFFGKPGTWMSQFATDKRKLMGIRTDTDRSYKPSNVNMPGTKW
jgi:hypothetical protein